MRPPSLRLYIGVLGATLLGQGLLSWLLDWSGHAGNGMPARLANSDPRHALIHVAWGAGMLGILAAGLDERGCARLALAFGVFYTALAVLGIAVHHPLGLRLDRGENAFHLLVGPSAVLVGLAARRLGPAPA